MRPPGLVAWVVAHARWARAELIHAGYVIRPYDQVTDGRRWRWQRARRCGFPTGVAQAIAEAIAQSDAEYRQWKADHPGDAARWETQAAAIDRIRERGRGGRAG